MFRIPSIGANFPNPCWISFSFTQDISQQRYLKFYTCKLFYVLLTVHPNITIALLNNLMHKFFILIHLLHSSTCFEHYCAHLQEDSCINTASGIVNLFGWLFSTQVTRGLLVICVLNSHIKRVTIPNAVLRQLSSWRWAE